MPNLAGARAANTLYFVAIIALFAVGLAIRTWGVLVDPLDFWADEAWWAGLLESWNLDDLGIRPIGYMWLSRQLVEFGSPEILLRLLSWLTGIAALVFIYRSAGLLFRSRVAVLLVLLLAVVHPNLIVFAKEFKPYSLEVFVHSALTFWALRLLRDNRASVGMLLAAVAALPFCYSVVFLYPALALPLGNDRLARLRRLAPWKLVAATLVAGFMLFLLHIYLFELLNAAQSRWFWGGKYGVFPIDTGFFGGVAWYVEKTWSLFSLPGAIAGTPAGLVPLWGLAYVGGAGVLLTSGRRREFMLLFVPLIATALANLLGYWPYGAFRANLFLIPGALLLVGLGIDWLASGQRTRWAAYGILAAVLIGAAMAEPATYRTKLAKYWAAAPQHTEVLDAIERRRIDERDRWTEVILADWHSWQPIAYYLREYPDLRDRVRLVRGPLADTAMLERQLAQEVERARREGRATRLWLVVTHLSPHRAVHANELVRKYAVHQREFASPDRDYHPLMIELRF